jgi:hypothetical protein
MRIERLWRWSGVTFVGLAIVAAVLAGAPPGLAASHDALTAHYIANESPLLIGSILFAFGVVLLLWFAAALRAVLDDAGRDGWGAAVTVAGAATAALLLVGSAVTAALAYTIALQGDDRLTSALNDLLWAIFVVSSWPRGMLILAGSFGLWRAGLISVPLFRVAVVVAILALLGGTTWEADFGALWSPDGVYSAVVSPALGLVWVLAASRVLIRIPPTRTAF